MANTSDRSKFIPFDRNAKTEEFKRPDHPDFLTATELAAQGFTGVRSNSLNGDMECWVHGKKEFSVGQTEMGINPAAFEIAYAEHFGIF